MAALYEISAEYREMFEHLSEELSNEEIENKDQLIADTLVDIANRFDEKALNVAMFIAELEAQSDAVAKVAKSQAERGKSLSKKAEKLREYLMMQMQSMGKDKLQNEQITLQVAKNPVKVVIHDDSAIPEEFKKRTVEVSIDKTAIKTAINAGTTVEGACLVNSTHLKIK